MSYLYHRVPSDLRGTTLYPLNTLRDTHPDIYNHHMSKYNSREHVTQQRIPIFDNCLWNDVLFLTAAHPTDLYAARREAGWSDLSPQHYYKIDPHSLDSSHLGVFLFDPNSDPAHLTSDDFTRYDSEQLDHYATIPQATKDYFKHEFEIGAPHIKLFYRYIPHILYHGNIDVTHTEIITTH